MDGQMDEWMDKWMNGWMIERITAATSATPALALRPTDVLFMYLVLEFFKYPNILNKFTFTFILGLKPHSQPKSLENTYICFYETHTINPLSAGDAFKRIHTVFPQPKFDRN